MGSHYLWSFWSSMSAKRLEPTLNMLRHASSGVVDNLKLQEDLKSNPFYGKYADKLKLATASKQEPRKNYIERLEEVQDAEKKQEVEKEPPANWMPTLGTVKPVSKRLSPLLKTNELREVVRLELLESKSKMEVAHIWREYHKNIDVISAVLPRDAYIKIRDKSSEYPIFLLPLPRKEGYEFMLCQFSKNEVHFTPLLSWQTHKEHAPECLAMVYFTELMDTKEIVLMKGEYDKKVLNSLEAQCLANTLQLYYGEDNKRRNRLLQTFTHNPEKFQHMDLVSEMQALGYTP